CPTEPGPKATRPVRFSTSREPFPGPAPPGARSARREWSPSPFSRRPVRNTGDQAMWFSSVRRWLQGASKSTRRGLFEAGPSRRPKPTCRPGLEVLEDRTVPTTFTVTNLANDGLGSLRQAIDDSNAVTSDADVIVFQPGLTGTI